MIKEKRLSLRSSLPILTVSIICMAVMFALAQPGKAVAGSIGQLNLNKNAFKKDDPANQNAPQVPSGPAKTTVKPVNINGSLIRYWIISDQPNELVLGVEYSYSGMNSYGSAPCAVIGANPIGSDGCGLAGFAFHPIQLIPGRNTATITINNKNSGIAFNSKALEIFMYTCGQNSQEFFRQRYAYVKHW